MRAIAIVGAGQAGLLLAIALKKQGYRVTLVSNRTAEQIRAGCILSSQGMFDSALQIERSWGLNFWDETCPWNTSVTFTLGMPGKAQQALQWQGKTSRPFQSVDQRLKFSRWLHEFECLGGDLIIQEVNGSELNELAAAHELTLVAGGKGEISQLFPRDDQRSHFESPQRALACLYVTGMVPVKTYPGVRANLIPGVGEYFTMPGLTLTGPCEMMLFEGVPGGAFDCWHNLQAPEEQLAQAKRLLKQYVPWEAERCEQLQLTNGQATLTGRYTPTVRKPLAKMPCGKWVLGMGDTVVLNDPVAGQGANNATKCAAIYFNRIVAQRTQPFSEAWMQATFEHYWQQCAQAATQWSTMLLLPPPPHVLDLLNAAAKLPTLADKLANAFDNPASLFPWINDPAQTHACIAAEKITQQQPALA